MAALRELVCYCLAAAVLSTVAACGGEAPDAPPSVATAKAVVDATAVAAADVIAAALGNDDRTPAAVGTSTVAPTFTAIAEATVSPTPTETETSTPVSTYTPAVTPTETATPTPIPTSTPDRSATATAQTHEFAIAVAATLTAQPTATRDWAATQAAEKQQIATAIASTLTAQPTATFTSQPTATPRPPATPAPLPAVNRYSIGSSVLGRSLEVIEIGSGTRTLILVGGLHAGSAPSTVSLAQQAADYFSANPYEVPRSLTLSIVLNANPDARYAPGKLEGRLNANGVDLNRNWDCDWQPQAKWRDHTVSGGGAPLSEPETQALAAYILNHSVAVVAFWEAKMENGQVSAGGCGDRSLASQPFAESYGRAAGYLVEPWTWYPVNGDASNWLDRQGIPAISVLILDYERVDWENNLRGIRSLLDSYN